MELKISDKFTLDDIRKIREYNDKMTEGMSVEERNAYYDKGAKEFLEAKAISDKKKIEEMKEILRDVVYNYYVIYNNKDYRAILFGDIDDIIKDEY